MYYAIYHRRYIFGCSVCRQAVHGGCGTDVLRYTMATVTVSVTCVPWPCAEAAVKPVLWLQRGSLLHPSSWGPLSSLCPCVGTTLAANSRQLWPGAAFFQSPFVTYNWDQHIPCDLALFSLFLYIFPSLYHGCAEMFSVTRWTHPNMAANFWR